MKLVITENPRYLAHVAFTGHSTLFWKDMRAIHQYLCAGILSLRIERMRWISSSTTTNTRFIIERDRNQGNAPRPTAMTASFSASCAVGCGDIPMTSIGLLRSVV
jgi:hypothetical protein